MDEENLGKRNEPGFEGKRPADFGKVEAFWINLGFRNALISYGMAIFANHSKQSYTGATSRKSRDHNIFSALSVLTAL